jgi:hypothetical protein
LVSCTSICSRHSVSDSKNIGFLFFLSPGILFAFKKPLLFLPFHNITSISYTSVLQRTFNLSIAAREPGTENEIEIEFSMVDQEEFAGIDAYIKKHGLNDASLADNRRAKIYNVNAKKGAATTENGVSAENGVADDGFEGETEIQKAERLLQDAEDEAEEDYEESDDESYDEDEESDLEGDADEEMDDEEGYDQEGGGEGEAYDEEEEEEE